MGWEEQVRRRADRGEKKKPRAADTNTNAISSVQSLSHFRLFATPWTAACQASLSITNSWSLLKPMSIKSVMPSSHLILCRPLLLPPSIFPSIRVFSNESVPRIRWPKYWSFRFGISPSNEYSGLISFRIDWFDLLTLQGTLKSLLQYHSSKESILQHSAFFMIQLSHPYTTTGKTIALPLSIMAAVVKNSFANEGDIRDAGWIPGSGRPSRGRHANWLHYSCLENSMDRGA